MTGLYIHIPFCLTKCPYCDFYSERYSKSLAAEYTRAVIRNLEYYNEAFDTVYFGGGTPVLLAEEIGQILKNVHVSESCEITVEANPCISDEGRLKTLLDAGVNRISFGVQSFNDDELQFLGRRHNAAQAVDAICCAYNAGFRNISVDLMIGLPNQTTESVKKSIDKFAQLPVNHVSAYLLKIEENTPFAKMNIEIPDDEVSELYVHTCEFSEQYSFKQYEISNFARGEYECKHNLKYWRCEEYLGIGAAAHSYYKGVRFCTERSIAKFISNEHQLTTVTDEICGDFDEFAMLKLRLAEGLTFEECEKFGVEKSTILARCRKIPPEYIFLSDNGVRLTRQGFLLSNAVIGKILGY